MFMVHTYGVAKQPSMFSLILHSSKIVIDVLFYSQKSSNSSLHSAGSRNSHHTNHGRRCYHRHSSSYAGKHNSIVVYWKVCMQASLPVTWPIIRYYIFYYGWWFRPFKIIDLDKYKYVEPVVWVSDLFSFMRMKCKRVSNFQIFTVSKRHCWLSIMALVCTEPIILHSSAKRSD